MPRESWFGRLVRHFHEHPKGRLHEFFFWAAIGLAFGAFAFFGWRAGFVTTPFALMIGIVAACFLGWSMLPRPKTRAPPPLPSGKRGEIQRAVRESKAEAKKKRGPPGPPPPPIRRG